MTGLLHRSVRRKYGIPDDDNDPFNVAYAKAQARRKELAQKRAQQQSVPEVKTAAAAQEGLSTKQDQAGPSILRRRMVPSAREYYALLVIYLALNCF